MKNEIQVPRDNPKNKGVCRAVENLVLDLICKDITEAWHVKDLTAVVNQRLGRKFGDNLGNHVMHAVDQFFANDLIKRVAPSVFQAIEGPDEVFSERQSGHVPEGEPYAERPKNYNNCGNTPTRHARAIFNQQVRAADASIGIFLTCQDKKSPAEILEELTYAKSYFNPVAVKVALRQRGLTI